MIEPAVPEQNPNAPDTCRRPDDRFCPLCDVVLDLHDGPDTCRSAGMKADLLSQFWTIGGVA